MPDLCTLTGTLRDATGAPFGPAEIILRPAPPEVVVTPGGSIVVPVTVGPFWSGADGATVLPLEPGQYFGEARGPTGQVITFPLAVPDLTSAALEEYIGRRDVEVLMSAESAAARALAAQGASEAGAETSTEQALIAGQQAAAAAASATAAGAMAILAGIKTDTAQGLATTTVGQSFAVKVDGGFAVYRHDAGAPDVATLIGVLPDVTRVTDIEAALHQTNDDDDYEGPGGAVDGDPSLGAAWPWLIYGWQYQIRINGLEFRAPLFDFDNDDPMAAHVETDADGLPTMIHLIDGTFDFLREGESRAVIDSDNDDPLFPHSRAWTDASGRLAMAWVDDEDRINAPLGQWTLDFIAEQIGGGGGTAVAPSAALLPGNQYAGELLGNGLMRWWSDVSGMARSYIGLATAPPVMIEENAAPMQHEPALGDSNSEASGATPIITTGTPAPNTLVMLSTGIRGGAGATFVPGSVSDFAPAAEAVNGILGETGWCAFGRMLDVLQATGPRRQRVVRSSGMSGKRLDELLPGSVFFTNLVAEATRSRDIAATYGRTMRCFNAYLPGLGANDRSATSPVRTKAAYLADLITLQAGLTTSLGTVFSQANQIDLWQTQLPAPNGSSATLTASDVALAQLQAALDQPNIHLVCPEYHLPFAAIDNEVHGAAVKNAVRGELTARAAWRRERFGATVFCPMPRTASITKVGNVVSIPYDCVSNDAGGWHPLAWSTADRVQQVNQGFAVSAGTITGVAIRGDGGAATGVGYVDITLAAPPATGTIIEYAYAEVAPEATVYPRAWGNLADTCPALSLADPGRVLRNYAPILREALP